MSTMQEQFEAMLVLYYPCAEMMNFKNSEGVPEYCNAVENLAWKMWQAATEAAKATGTAGELPELPIPAEIHGWPKHPTGQPLYSFDQMREYGQACAAMARGAAVRDYIENGAEAAQQPAPALQRHVYEWLHLVETKIGTPTAASAACVLKEFYEGAEPDAALAATAAPVLSDEQILTIAKKELGHWNYEDDVVAFAQAILAATRSQP